MQIVRLDTSRPVNHAFLTQILTTRAARTGGIVRRSIESVEQEVGRQLFFDTMKSRGFHVLEAADQYIVVCSSGDLILHF